MQISLDLVEEACQQAWLILLRRQPKQGPTLFAWLVTVAVHEGYRLSALQRRTVSLHDASLRASHEQRPLDALPAPDVVDDTLEARRALRALASLPERQRRFVVLKVAGWSYEEIAAREHVSFTAVNKHLVKARKRLREAAELAA